MTARQKWLSSNRTRHPVGDGNPGPHNWSGRDERTATQEPLGGVPQLVQWSCSIVLTPKGWVGRVDFYLPALRTYHCAVEPNLPSEVVVLEASNLIDEDMRGLVDDLLTEFHAQPSRNRAPAYYGRYIADDFDFNEPVANGTDFLCPECGGALQELGTEDVGGVMEVTFFECMSCGGFAVLPDYHSCTPIDPYRTKPSRQPAWRQAWWKVFGGK